MSGDRQATRKRDAHCAGDKPDFDGAHCKFIASSIEIYTRQMAAAKAVVFGGGEAGAEAGAEAAAVDIDRVALAADAKKKADACRPGRNGATKRTCQSLGEQARMAQQGAINSGQAEVVPSGSYRGGGSPSKGGNGGGGGDDDKGSSTAGIVVGVVGVVIGIAVAVGAVLYSRKQVQSAQQGTPTPSTRPGQARPGQANRHPTRGVAHIVCWLATCALCRVLASVKGAPVHQPGQRESANDVGLLTNGRATVALLVLCWC